MNVNNLPAARPQNSIDDELRLIKTALEHVSYSVMITTTPLEPPGSEIVYVTPAFTKMTGYEAGEVIGKSPTVLHGPNTDQALLAHLRDHLSRGESFRGELINYRKDGSEYLVELLIDPVRETDGSVTHWVTVQQDITNRKRAEEMLLQAERLAGIGAAMAGLSHESRNALQRSQACLELLVDEIGDQTQAKQLILGIQKAQDDLHQLYEDVREFAAPIRIDPELFYLDDILGETWSTLALKREGRSVQFEVDGRELDLSCEVDGFALRQIFRNILENSLAACADPVRINVTFSETEFNDKPALEVSLRDNGPGLNEEQQRRIFDEFYTTKTHGTGLGMAIVKRFVDAHRGSVVVEPPGDDGIEIVVTLPVSHDQR